MATTEQLNARLRPLVAGYYETHDEALLGQVLELLRPTLLRYARHSLGVRDLERAQDAAQDALLEVLLRLRTRRFVLGEGSVVGYARECCRRCHLHSVGGYAARSARPGKDDDPYLLLGATAAEQPADLSVGAEYAAEASTAVGAATAAVLGLDAHARAAVVLHYYQGLPVPEAAARLGLDEQQYRTRLSRGVAALRTWGEGHPLPDEVPVWAGLPRLDTGNLFTEPLRLAS